MGYASRSGRASTSVRNPRAFAVCDRCGIWHNHVNLQFQFQWRGTSLQNTQKLVCRLCLDRPQEQLRAITLPADPLPIPYARLEYFVQAETNTRFTSGQNTVDAITGLPVIGGNQRITEDSNTRTTQATGEPPGGLNQQPGTSISVPDDIGGSDPGLPYGYLEVPKTGPLNGE